MTTTCIQFARSVYLSRLLKLGALVALIGVLLNPPLTRAQAQFSEPTMLTSQNQGGLADILNRVQHIFLTPITFEEAPFENQAQLRSIVLVHNGVPQIRIVNPITDFSVTLNASVTAPLLAAQSVLAAYVGAGRPGIYSAVVLNDRVDVIPAQVLGVDGAMRNVTPIMSEPVTFPIATRSIAETLQLVADDVSLESGFKVILLNFPGSPLDTLELGSSGLPARDVIAEIGTMLNRPVSFQCLYDPGSKTYYLSVIAVVPDPVPGGPAQHGTIKPTPTVGPPNSPFFIKK